MVHAIVDRQWAVEERMTLRRRRASTARGRSPPRGRSTRRASRRRPGSGCSRSSSRSTAGRCRAGAATASSSRRRPARPRTRSPPAARWSGRRSRRCWSSRSARTRSSRARSSSRRPAPSRSRCCPTPHGGVLWCDGRRSVDLPPGARVEVRRGPRPVRLARLHAAPFTDRLVAKFELAGHGLAGSGEPTLERRRPVIEEIRIRGLGVIDDAVLELARRASPRSPGRPAPARPWCVTGTRAAARRQGRRRQGPRRRRAARRSKAGSGVAASGTVADRVREAGGDLDDDDALQLARTVSGEGRSRAYAGGRSAPASLLAELADDLVAVHGQSDQQRLLQPARQRARARPLRRRPRSPRRTPRTARRGSGCERSRRSWQWLSTRARERAQEARPAPLGLAEVEAADPQPGEDGELAPRPTGWPTPSRSATPRLVAHAALHAAPRTPVPGRGDAAGSGPPRGRGPARARRRPRGARRPARGGRPRWPADVAADLASYAASVDVRPGPARPWCRTGGRC